MTINIEQKQYKTYILTDDLTGSQIEVVPERGGIITQWRVQGQDILYLDAPRFAQPEMSVRGGIPILFPICGNLPDNKYNYAEKEYILKQHGFARNSAWQIIQDEIQASITLELTSNAQTQAVYPFDFKLAFTYMVSGDRLQVRSSVTNLSSEPMPFSIGFHPYLVTDKNQLQFDIPSAEFQDQITQKNHSFNGNFDFSQDEIDVAFKKLNAKSASVTDLARKLKITLDYDEIYSTLVFWTVKGKDYYCLEPWSAPRNALNTGEQLITLPPQTETSANFSLSANFF